MKKIILSLILGMFLISFISAVIIDTEDVAPVTNVYFVNETEVFHNNLSGIQGGSANEYYHLNQSTFNYLIANLWDFITSAIPRWIINPSSNYLYNDTDTLYFNESFLNNTIDARDTDCSATGDCPNVIYWDNESILDVNRSDFWDDLNSPSDILGSQINNDLNWINSSEGLNETDPLWSGNSSTVARNGNCPSGQVVQNTTNSGVQCVTSGGGGGTPAGSNGEVQFNDAGSFGANSNFTWDNTNNRLGIGTSSPTARLHLPAGTTATNTTPLKLTSGSLLTAPEIGALEFETDDLYFGITTPLAATYTGQYPVAHNGNYVKATSYYSTSFYQYFATDPSLSLIGDWTGKVWLSANGQNTNQRFHIDLGSAKKIEKVYYENLHTIGAATDRGVRAFTLWGSNNASDFNNLTYSNDGTWVQLTTDVSEFDKHSEVNAADPKYVMVTNNVSYRYYAFKFSTNWGGNYMGLRHVELQTQDPLNYRKKVVLDDGVDLVSGRVPYISTNGRLISSSNFLFDGTSLTAGYLGLLAGTTSPHTAPISFTSGSLMDENEVGAMEFKDDDLYFTITSGDGTYTPQYPPAQSSVYVAATTTHPSLDYVPWYATNPSLPLTGTWQLNSWLSASGASRLNNRFSIDLGSAKTITNVMYNNGHHYGGSTNSGAKNFLMYGSNNASDFADTSYGTGSDGDWVLLNTSVTQFDQHIGSNVADPKTFTIANTVAYRYYSFRIADNWGHGTYTNIRHIELQTSDKRKSIVMTADENPLTSGRVPYATTGGKLTDSSNLTFDGSKLGINEPNPLYPLQVNGTVSGISIFSEGNISATGYNTRTSVYNKTDGSALDYIKDADLLIDNGEINHSKFYGYVGKVNVTDYSLPEIKEVCNNEPIYENYTDEVCDYNELPPFVGEYEKVCNKIIRVREKQDCKTIKNCYYSKNSNSNNYEKICNDVVSCKPVTFENCTNQTIYPHTKEVGQVSLGSEIDVLRQGIVEYKEAGLPLKFVENNTNKTAFRVDTILAENYVTNTTKDLQTVDRIVNFRNTLSGKTYNEMVNLILDPVGKLSTNVLMQSEISELGSYNVNVMAHYNRASIVMLLWENVKQQEEIDNLTTRLNTIEADLCTMGYTKYC